MNRWISSAIVFLFYISQAVSQAVSRENHTLVITGGLNQAIPVWMNDAITIQAENTFIFQWFFNNQLIVEYDDTAIGNYVFPNPSILNNISAMITAEDSLLNLPNVSHAFTGIYEADDEARHSLNMTVYGNNLCKFIYLLMYDFSNSIEANLSSIEFILNNSSGSCKAYVFIIDSINPPNSEITRMPFSASFGFNLINTSNASLIEINSSQLNTASNSIHGTILVQYTFTSNNFNTVMSKDASLSKIFVSILDSESTNGISFSDISSISPPTITVDGISNNRTVLIRHNRNVLCVHSITYCLNTSNSESQCNSSINFNELQLKYPGNSTSGNLSIIYDVIYAKYSFDIDLTQYLIEGKRYSQRIFFQVADRKQGYFLKTTNTIRYNSLETTTLQSGTSDDDTTWKNLTDYTISINSSTSSNVFFTNLITSFLK